MKIKSVLIFLIRRRRRYEETTLPVSPRRYRPVRKSGVVTLETIDEDVTVPPRRLRASPLSSDSFREVSRGLGAANRAMDELSRVSQESQIYRARRARDNLEPTFDTLAFDDWMENIVSIEQTYDVSRANCMYALYDKHHEVSLSRILP